MRPLVPFVRVSIARAGARVRLERAAWLTPYAVQTIGDDALRAGPRGRLEVVVSPEAGSAGVGAARDRFAWLARHGLDVLVRLEGEPGPAAARRRSGWA